MARKIAFDYETALESATRLFWKNGYSGTALRELLKVMEIGEGSFYNTLKGKKQLYLKCLERYEDTEVHRRLEALASAPTAAEGICAFFDDVLASLDNPNSPSRLCMIAAMAAEDVLSEPDLRDRAKGGLDAVQARLCERLSQDQDKGMLPPSLNPQVAASVITTYLQGLWRMALVDYDRAKFEQQIGSFLTGLGLR
ncbi:TetR/AcrR family transcriptional regulator [Mesorhizobium sp. M3A.F.Ca.ET.201.01.1.1]|uniref:TetR/AcrR family transcriptional regulator n=1 Tax=Mesorhizobium sp. M3A.F.Ca.ET.201.01.1.1 TaxID=2563946 RepID=UPI001093E633|nr:TetR/AcrR family transcriptional regulator [Mesorhizobium sp. M3A.F.Ca.ET.201.01.1.1]TGS65571.1 TetR/AcrR family transcriptional regulator [Mesorhizobium sp. M3A.F.Ca.ET.201.01.1.1]